MYIKPPYFGAWPEKKPGFRRLNINRQFGQMVTIKTASGDVIQITNSNPTKLSIEAEISTIILRAEAKNTKPAA